jgi:SAM-dependent methyltransferase
LQGPSGERLPVVPSDLDFSIEFGDNEILGTMQEYYYPSSLTLPIPKPENIIRVAGPVGEAGFIFGGGTWFIKLNLLANKYLGTELSQLNAILDWGCGCGRILRFFREKGLDNIYGADIDGQNIDWIRQNFHYNNVCKVDFDPPMPFDDQFFDLVYGHSVFTHLSLPDHKKWITEISRIVKIGGFAFLTVCSEFGTYLTRQSDIISRPEIFDEYLLLGFYEFETQDVGVDEERPGYYRLCSQSTEFIRDIWSKHFKIRRIFRGFAEHQDLVVLEKL